MINIVKKLFLFSLILVVASCSKTSELDDFYIEIKTKNKLENILIIASHRGLSSGSCFFHIVMPVLHSGGGTYDFYTAKLASSNEKIHFEGSTLKSECYGSEAKRDSISIKVIQLDLGGSFSYLGFAKDSYKNKKLLTIELDTLLEKLEGAPAENNAFALLSQNLHTLQDYRRHFLGQNVETKHLFVNTEIKLLQNYEQDLKDIITTHSSLTEEERKSLLFMYERFNVD